MRNRNPDNGERIDYNAERAKLVKAKRENEEYDLRLKRRELHIKIFSQLEKRRASRTRKAAQPPKEPIAARSKLRPFLAVMVLCIVYFACFH